MSLRRQRRHDLLVTLPDEVPVDRRNAQHVVPAIERRTGAGAVGFGCGLRHQRARAGIKS